MSKYIHCGEWNKNYYYILLATIFAFITNYTFGYTFTDYLNEIKIYNQIIAIDDNKDNNDNNHIIINYIFRYLGLILLSSIFYKYKLHNTNKSLKNNSQNNFYNPTSIKLIYNNSQENTKNEIITSLSFILLIMIIMVLQEISEDLYYKSNLRPLDFWMLELPLLSYFNLKYFKIKIYLHHKLIIYFYLITCGIYKIIYLIAVINDDDKKRKEGSAFENYNNCWGVIPLGIITYLIIMISRAFALSEIKILMQYKYLSPIKLLIIYGIIGTIITTIIGIISTFIECNSFFDLKICKIKDDINNDTTYLENFKIWWKNEIEKGKILLLLIGIIIDFFYKLFYFLIIKNLTAIHIIFSKLFYTTLLTLVGNCFIHYIRDMLIDFFIFIFHIIIIFGLLIYLEMIELDCCNLNYNLKKTIIDRSIQDYELKSDNADDEIDD